MEYYCAHNCGNVDLGMDELSRILVQCRTDQLTSENSTFPFPAAKCQEYLEVIKDCQGVLSFHDQDNDSGGLKHSIQLCNRLKPLTFAGASLESGA